MIKVACQQGAEEGGGGPWRGFTFCQIVLGIKMAGNMEGGEMGPASSSGQVFDGLPWGSHV